MKSKTLFIVLLITSLVSFTCIAQLPKSYYLLEGKTYQLENGYIVESEEASNKVGEECYHQVIYLLSSSFKYSENSIAGHGAAITLEMNSPLKEGLQGGSYLFSNHISKEKEPFTLLDVEIAFGSFDSDSTKENDFTHFIVDGWVHVSRTDSIYNIGFELKTENNAIVQGEFIGTISIVDVFKD